MKRALVTGSAGFVGRHMVASLADRGFLVDGCDIASPCASRDALSLFREDTRQFDLVVHAAATAPHRAAIDSRPATHIYNQLLDAAMFDWAVRTSQRRVLYLSSSAAYPVDLQKWPGHRLWEGDAEPDGSGAHIADTGWGMTPDSSYGWTKLTGEGMAVSARAAGVPVTVVRPFSGYGEGQGENWPFGAFVARARRREDPFVIWGSGQQVRDWIHIDDLVAGALAVVDADVREPVNLCTGVGASMTELATMMCAEAGYEPAFHLCEDAPSGVAYRVGDPARMREVYRPKVPLPEGVRQAMQSVSAKGTGDGRAS